MCVRCPWPLGACSLVCALVVLCVRRPWRKAQQDTAHHDTARRTPNNTTQQAATQHHKDENKPAQHGHINRQKARHTDQGEGGAAPGGANPQMRRTEEAEREHSHHHGTTQQHRKHHSTRQRTAAPHTTKHRTKQRGAAAPTETARPTPTGDGQQQSQQHSRTAPHTARQPHNSTARRIKTPRAAQNSPHPTAAPHNKMQGNAHHQEQAPRGGGMAPTSNAESNEQPRATGVKNRTKQVPKPEIREKTRQQQQDTQKRTAGRRHPGDTNRGDGGGEQTAKLRETGQKQRENGGGRAAG